MATLWTIGYEGQALHDVVGRLVEARIELLVDVRLRPQSRKPGLSKTPLSHALGLEGLGYEHRRALGTPLDIRGLFRAGEFEPGRAQYREYLDADEEACAQLAWLADVASRTRTAILCFEYKAAECHRRVIAELLHERNGFDVVDL